VLLISISDISNDILSSELESIGYSLGVSSMREVWLLVEPWFPADGSRVAITVTEESCFEVMRFLFSMAVINYATLIHEEFEIPSIEMGVAIRFKRFYPQSVCEASVFNYLSKMREVMDKFGSRGFPTGR